MKRFIITILLFLLPHLTNAIDYNRIVGGRAASLGRTAIADQSVWSVHNNPSGIALLKGWSFGLYYENQWMLKETAFKSGSLTASIPKVGCFGLSVNQFGSSQYNESSFGLAYARSFGPYLQMGLRVDYLLLHFGEGYPNRGAFDFALGVQSQVTEKLRLGACLTHPIMSRWKTLNEDQLPIVMRLGMSYQLTQTFVGQVDVERDSGRDGVRIGAGFEYQLFNRFWMRVGVQHNPNMLSFGIGYQLGWLKIDISAQMHQMLGAVVMGGGER